MLMRDCSNGSIRDMLPDFVHGTLPEKAHAEVAAHVAGCADCQAEVQLIRSAGMAYPAPAVNMSRIVSGLPAGYRRTTGRGLAGRQWLLAAGASFLVIGAISLAALRGTFGAGAASVRAADSTVASGSGVDAGHSAKQTPVRLAQRESVEKARRDGGLRIGGLADLTDEQLATLLRDIDALDASLSMEPEARTVPSVVLRKGDSNDW